MAKAGDTVTITSDMTDEEIRNLGLRVLRRELGLTGFVRFMRHFVKGSGDYSVERRQWLDQLTVEEILDEIRKSRE